MKRRAGLLANVLGWLLIGTGCVSGNDNPAPIDDDDVLDDDTGDDDDTSPDDDSTGDDDTTPPETPLLDSIDPVFGPLAGGIEVQFFGSNFTTVEDTLVRFGATEAQVISVEPQRIVAIAPEIPMPQTVSASVATSGGTALLDNAYTAGDDYSGLTGVIARHWRVSVLDASVSPNPYSTGIWSEVRVFEPAAFSLQGEFPASESCVRDFASSNSGTMTARDAGAEVVLATTNHDFVLPRNNDGWYEASGNNGDWQSLAMHDIEIPGGAGFVADTIQDAIEAPAVTMNITPDLSDWQNNSMTLSGSFVIQITGGSPAERLLVWLDFYDGGGTYAGNLVCNFASEASPLISPAFLSGLPAGHALVTVIRQNTRVHALAEGSQLAAESRSIYVGGLSVVQ